MNTSLRTLIISSIAIVTMSFRNPVAGQEEEVRRTEPVTATSPSAAASAAATTPPLSSAVTPSPAPAGPPALTDVLFKNLKARAIGPAVMGGRVSDIAIDPRNPFIFYVGLAHGGVFKTGDNGVSFDPI